MFEITKVKTCSIKAPKHHPAVKKLAKTVRFTGSCTASKQVWPQKPNITDLDPVQQNVTHRFLIESQGICWQFSRVLMCQSQPIIHHLQILRGACTFLYSNLNKDVILVIKYRVRVDGLSIPYKLVKSVASYLDYVSYLKPLDHLRMCWI